MKYYYEVSVNYLGCYCDSIEVDDNVTEEEIRQKIIEQDDLKIKIDIYTE